MRIVVADDHPLFRLGLKSALEHMGFNVSEAVNGLEAQSLTLEGSTPPDAVILDLKMPEQDGLTTLKHLRAGGYKGIVVLLTTFSEPAFIAEAAKHGADAYWSKDLHPQVLSHKLHGLQNGSEAKLCAPDIVQLTSRELEVVQALAEGMSTKTIAQQLGVSPETVKVYQSRIYAKLGVNSKMDAVNAAKGLGLIV